ncbi:hypothetical protein [Rubripirellula reticaptiva]|nr:hypothetical protein [Rubripirellula reticaptiva]
MNSQVRFAMHPADERDFEHLLVSDEAIRFIAGPRWKAETPVTSRSLADIDTNYCIVWSTSDIAKLKAEYIPACDDWYCRSEYATIQFLRSEIDEALITEGRIAVSTVPSRDFPTSRVKSLEKRYSDLRKYFRKNYSNSIIQWRNPTVAYAPAGPNRSANPSKPDPQVWVGPHALRWLREEPDRRIKQSRQSIVEAVLVDGMG